MSNRLEPGARVGDLVIERELGRGAFAVVYLARDLRLGRRVALKVLGLSRLSASEDTRDRLLEEARTVAALKSAHVVPLLRVHDLDPGGLGLEMEYVEGGSLADRLAVRHALDPEEGAAHTRAILRALEDAHAQGIVHCDLKPENVLLTERGEARLTDFGLGRRISEASLSGEHGARLRGTPLYMAPEVVAGERPTAASDLWGVGVLLYRMLAGRLPFECTSLPALFYAIHHDQPEPLGPEHPDGLAKLVARCLAKDPAQRPASAAEALRTLVPAVPGSGSRTSSVALALGRITPRGPRPVGREVELAALEGVLAACEAGRGGAALLTGEAGAGKSTLLHETARRADERGMRWIEASLTPLGGLQRPLLLAARRLLMGESGPGGLGGEVTSARFGAAAPLLRTLLLEDAYDLQGRQQFVWAFESLLRGLAQERPVVLAIEDLHLADGDDLRALGELMRRLGDSRACILAAHRSHDPGSSSAAAAGKALTEMASWPGMVNLAVGPLREEALQRLVLAEAGAERVAPEVLERICEHCEGNPLFALELVRHWSASDAVKVRAQRLAPGVRWEEAAFPHRLTELVSSRLQRLTPEERDLLDAAAVDGVTFDGAALAAVLGQGLLPTLRTLQRVLREHGLLVAQESGFRFAHALFRDVIYQELSHDLRRMLHRALAEHLEAQGTGRSDPERLGVHWTASGERRRATPYLRAAAVAAARRQQYHRALDLGARSGVFDVDADADAVAAGADVAFALVGCLSDLGENERIPPLLEPLERAARASHDELLSARVTLWRADTTYHARGPEAVDRAELAGASVTLGQTLDAGHAKFLLGRLARWSGRLEEAQGWMGDADVLFGLHHVPHMRAQVQFALGGIEKMRGNLAEAERRFRESAREHLAAGRRTDAAVADVLVCVTLQDAGRLEDLEGRMRAAIEALERAGATRRASHATVYLGRILVGLGRLADARAVLEAAVAALREHGNVGGEQEALLELADLYTTLGLLGESRQALDRFSTITSGSSESETILAWTSCLARWASYAGSETALREASSRLCTLPVEGCSRQERERAASRLAEALALLAPSACEGAHATMLRAASAHLGEAGQGRDGPGNGAACAEASRPASGVRKVELLLVSDLLRARDLALAGSLAEAAAKAQEVAAQCAALPFPALRLRALEAAMRVVGGGGGSRAGLERETQAAWEGLLTQNSGHPGLLEGLALWRAGALVNGPSETSPA